MDIGEEVLGDALGFLSERYGMPIFFPDGLTQSADAGKKPPVVRLHNVSGVSLRTAMRMLLSQAGLDMQLRDGVVVIVSRTDVESGRMLQQPVDVLIQGLSLDLALQRLSALTGVSVVLDPRIVDKANVAVTADFKDVSLKTAVRILADMAGLKPVVMENTFYVTSVENARQLEMEKAVPAAQSRKEVPKGVKNKAPKP